MAGETLVADLQFELNGLLLGEGTSYDIVQVAGWDDLPEIRTTDKEKALRHGLYPAADFYGKRVLVFELEVWANTPALMRAAIDALLDATNDPDADVAIVGRFPSYPIGDVLTFGKCRKREVPTTLEQQLGMGLAALQIECPDPRLYSNLLLTTSTGVVTSTGGLSFPLTFPLDFGGTGDSGTFQVTNLGNFEAPWTAQITGPITNPQIENLTTGELVRVDIALGAADTLLIDQDTRRVILNGTQSRYSLLSTDSDLTWGLGKGTTSLRFSGTTSGGPQLAFSWRHTRV